MPLTNFQKAIFKEVCRIPKGQTATYKKIAEKLRTSPRAVGQALKRNPNPEDIPCRRVVKSDGTLGGYFGKQYEKKKKLLKSEEVRI